MNRSTTTKLLEFDPWDCVEETSGSYITVMELARGGMGTVDIVLRQEGKFQRLYAIKRLLAQFVQDEAFHKMFLDEAKIAGLIRHPNVVSVVDYGRDERGPFLVMDLVDGLPLHQVLKRAAKDGPIPISFILDVAIGTAKGLHAAHEVRDLRGEPLNLVHRDLTPQNILLSWDGVAKVTDFGIAKASDRSAHTSTGILKGKWAYMSPEQLGFQELDRRSDLFTLGIVLCEMIIGRRLYGGQGGIKAARRILSEPPPNIQVLRPNVPPALVDLTIKLLSKDPAGRLDSAEDVVRCLEEIRSELPSSEGDENIASFLDERFGDWREARQDRLRGALDRLEERSVLGERRRSNTFEISLEELDSFTEPPTLMEPNQPGPHPVRDRTGRRRPWTTFVAPVALLLVGALIGVAGAHEPTPEPRADSEEDALQVAISVPEPARMAPPIDKVQPSRPRVIPQVVPPLPEEPVVRALPSAEAARLRRPRAARPARASATRRVAGAAESRVVVVPMSEAVPAVNAAMAGSAIPRWEWSE